MVKSIGDTWFISCIEVVRISEGPFMIGRFTVHNNSCFVVGTMVIRMQPIEIPCIIILQAVWISPKLPFWEGVDATRLVTCRSQCNLYHHSGLLHWSSNNWVHPGCTERAQVVPVHRCIIGRKGEGSLDWVSYHWYRRQQSYGNTKLLGQWDICRSVGCSLGKQRGTPTDKTGSWYAQFSIPINNPSAVPSHIWINNWKNQLSTVWHCLKPSEWIQDWNAYSH